MGQECAACAGQMPTATQQIARSAPLGRRDRGLREHPAAPQHGDFLGVDRVVCGLAAMEGLPGESVPEDKRDPMFRAEISPPGPRNHACGRQDHLLAVCGDGLEKRLWGGCHGTVQQRCTGLVEDAYVQSTGVEIDPAVQRVLWGGESPGGLLLVRYESFATLSIPRWFAGEGASISIM